MVLDVRTVCHHGTDDQSLWEYTSVLEIVETASLSDSVRAFNRGQLDMLGGTLAELAEINHSGKRTASAVPEVAY